MRDGTLRRADAGFTLTELLVVMAILGALATVAVIGVPAMLRRGDQTATETFITQLAAALEAYANNPRNGDFPPTTLEGYPGVGPLKGYENLGIESVVLCLNRPGQSGGFDFDGMEGAELQNQDGDHTQVALSRYGPDNKELYELVDLWGTPFAYFHYRDYATGEKHGAVSAPDANRAQPWKNPKTRAFFNPEGFQLISAGPDLTFNTDDDVTNFKR